MKRYGNVIGLRRESMEEYKKVHVAVWPGVLQTIKECNIQNYSIYLREFDDGRLYLISYFEYTGSDFKADMAKMAASKITQEWWAICKPMQQPLAACTADEWWASMEEVFHQD
jgi:L-rhamnose mutarotase